MTLIGSCTHEVTGTGPSGLGYPVTVKDYDREGNRCAYYSTVCADCLRKHKARGRVLEDDAAVEAWMDSSQASTLPEEGGEG